MGWNFKMITVQMKRELEKKKFLFFHLTRLYIFPSLIYRSVTVVICQSREFAQLPIV